MLDVLNVKLINGCNLACKGCSHMSQFATASSRIDIDQLKKDLITTHKNFEIEHHVTLLGGEILLEPRWGEVLSLIEDLWLKKIPQIRFYTNGMILSKHKEEVTEHIVKGSRLRISLHEQPNSVKGKHIINEINIFLNYAKKYINDLPSIDELLYSQDMWNIPMKVAMSNNFSLFWTELFKTKNNKLYPHLSNDIYASYKHCPCTHAQLYNGRLWKCPQTAYLRDTLTAFDQMDDPQWKPYLEYKGVSLEPTEEEKQEFYKNQKKPASFCSMCPKNGNYSPRHQETFKKIPIKQVSL
tara:strand:- start:1226 stop:2116 length:891 start_codon:yes stop_codon:yes gene_type:complete